MVPRTPPRQQGLRFNPKTFLAHFHDGIVTKPYGPGETVFAQGDPSNAVFYVERGRVQISVVSERGKHAVIATVNHGTFFGEACLTGQIVRPAAARAQTARVLSRIPKSSMARALRQHRAFSGYFTAYLLARNLRVEEDLTDQLFNSSEKRLARILMLLARFGKNGKSEPVIPEVSHATLASMIGTTRERVTHFMNKFRRLGFIEYNDNLEIHSSLINVILHD